jgi:hypothetical protein
MKFQLINMMKNTKTLLLFCCLLLGWRIADLKAQNGTVAGGGYQTSAGGSLSYTVGQIDYFELTGSGGRANPGKQQPFEIWVVVGAEIPGIDLTLAVYPNPTADFVLLRIDDGAFEHLQFTLFDINGQLLQKDELHQATTQIDLSQYAMGAYFLNVSEGDHAIKTFKVIKNQ